MMKYDGVTKNIRLPGNSMDKHRWVTVENGKLIPNDVLDILDKKEVIDTKKEAKDKSQLKKTEEQDFKKMTKDQLNDYAAELGLKKEVKSSMKKSDIIKKIKMVFKK